MLKLVVLCTDQALCSLPKTNHSREVPFPWTFQIFFRSCHLFSSNIFQRDFVTFQQGKIDAEGWFLLSVIFWIPAFLLLSCFMAQWKVCEGFLTFWICMCLHYLMNFWWSDAMLISMTKAIREKLRCHHLAWTAPPFFRSQVFWNAFISEKNHFFRLHPNLSPLSSDALSSHITISIRFFATLLHAGPFFWDARSVLFLHSKVPVRDNVEATGKMMKCNDEEQWTKHPTHRVYLYRIESSHTSQRGDEMRWDEMLRWDEILRSNRLVNHSNRLSAHPCRKPFKTFEIPNFVSRPLERRLSN